MIQSKLLAKLHILNEFKDYLIGLEFVEFYHKLVINLKLLLGQDFDKMLKFTVTEKQRRSRKMNSLVLRKNKIHEIGVIVL